MATQIFLGIEHMAIAARSPEALADWYARVLGFHVHATFDNGENKPMTYFIRLGGDGPFLEIFPANREQAGREKPNTEPGISHLAISVGNFEAALEILAHSGARPEGEERKGSTGFRVQFYRDPEGNLFHILYRPAPLPQGKSKA